MIRSVASRLRRARGPGAIVDMPTGGPKMTRAGPRKSCVSEHAAGSP
jgi:hypothetical protein